MGLLARDPGLNLPQKLRRIHPQTLVQGGAYSPILEVVRTEHHKRRSERPADDHVFKQNTIDAAHAEEHHYDPLGLHVDDRADRHPQAVF
jgi:hypothetical protein